MEAEEYKGRARSIIIGSLLKDIVDAATNINTAVGDDEDVYVALAEILTSVVGISMNVDNTYKSDQAYDDAAELLDKLDDRHDVELTKIEKQ